MHALAWLVLLSAGCFLPNAWVLCCYVTDAGTRQPLLISSAVSALGFFLAFRLIPVTMTYTLKAGLCGVDINKQGRRTKRSKVPESLGLASGVVFLVCMILFQQLHYYDVAGLFQAHHSGSEGRAFWPTFKAGKPLSDAWLVNYNAALAAICFMLFLGFVDDVLDIPWRVKLALPCIAALPLLIAYRGSTGVVVPKPLRFGNLGIPAYLELGVLYKVYMVLLIVFCTNSINILAGINGLEAGQTLVIASAVLLHNLVMLSSSPTSPAWKDGHLFSAYLMLPLISTTLALLVFNWYPSKVFVGDTFTYFAGMTLAVAGIFGHFSEMLLLFFIPQLFNFVYSLPQLLKFVPCPRHRLPRFEPNSGLLHATPNWNLVNMLLRVFGPCTEFTLCMEILAWQGVSCVAAFVVRHYLADWYK